MSIDRAINRVSYAEARSSNAEAMMDVVRHQREVQQATLVEGRSEAEERTRFEDEARQARAHDIDKTA